MKNKIKWNDYTIYRWVAVFENGELVNEFDSMADAKAYYNRFYVDFKLKEHDVFIEFNGQHHYENVKHFHSHGFTFEDQQQRDKALRIYCKQNKVKLIEIPYWDINNIDTILAKELGGIIK